MKKDCEWRWARKVLKPTGTQAVIRWANAYAPFGFKTEDVPAHLLGDLTLSQVRHNLLKMRTIKFIEMECGTIKRIRILAEGIGRLQSLMFSSTREAQAAGFSRRLINDAIAGDKPRGKVYAGYKWHSI